MFTLGKTRSPSPKMAPDSKTQDGSRPQGSAPSLIKVAECLYRLSTSGIYYAIIKKSGKQFRRSLKTKDRKLAERKLAVLRQKIARMKGEVATEILTFGELAKRWLESMRPSYKPGSARRREVCINQLRPFFDKVALKNISFAACEDWLRKRGNALSESSFNQERETLVMILDFAVSQNLILDNPASDIKRRKMRKATVVVPTREEFQLLLKTLEEADNRSQEAAHLVELLAYSGMRLAEATALAWEDIDWKKKTFHVSGGEKGTKNKRERVVPLFPSLAGFLERLRESRAIHTGRVIQITTAKRAISSACKRARIPRFTHHSFRHYFVSNAIEAGVDFATIAAWVGHLDGGVLVAKTYGHLREGHSHKMALLIT